MKVTSFLKLLNRKIKQYDKATTNPFTEHPVSITFVWVEPENKELEEYNLDKD